MFGRGYQFWMDGIHATGLIKVSKNPKVLDRGGFWVVLTTFEGEMKFAKFRRVRAAQFPPHDWIPLEGHWKSTLSKSGYISYVEKVRSAIEKGGVYQVNACRQLFIRASHKRIKLSGLFSHLLRENPAPFASYLSIPGLEVASASPERFLSRNGQQIKTSPIKGTIREDENSFGEKDKAENLMIVDLMRNDLSQVCEPGTVEVAQLFREEKHPGITHLVSDVEGTLKAGVKWSEILKATTPPGSVSGAPKSAALEIIEANESARGPYCGAIGWIYGDRAELAVGIRTFWSEEDSILRFGTGAGITWGSQSDAEWEETQLKARKLISIAGGVLSQ